jgi:Arc/MetJ-type ribon-helix-helix transcriptional regulator
MLVVFTMKKVEVIISDEQHRFLDAKRRELGYRTLSECLRQLIRDFLSKDSRGRMSGQNDI